VKLYRAKVPVIAHDVFELLVRENDVEVAVENRAEAEKDLVAIMEDFLKRDQEFRDGIRDEMSRRAISVDQYGSVRKAHAEQSGHPVGEDVERYLCRQFLENMMISRFVDEVYEDDKIIYKKVMGVLRSHDVDEREIRDAAASRIKNFKEGTVAYEDAMRVAMRDERKRRGLVTEREKNRDEG
jgi:hypothetical protein